jgi:uncharacterized protein
MKIKYVAFWLMLLCVFVFILQNLFGSSAFVLVKDLKFIQPWRLITSMFAHGSLSHLMSNMFSLLLFGLILEGRIGAKRVLWLFLLSGVVINIFSPYASSLGASGAIFAVLGVLVVLRPWMMVWVYSMPVPMFLAGLIWLGVDIFGVFYPSGVGNIAHLSGLFIGLIYGWYLWNQFSDKRLQPRH